MNILQDIKIYRIFLLFNLIILMIISTISTFKYQSMILICSAFSIGLISKFYNKYHKSVVKFIIVLHIISIVIDIFKVIFANKFIVLNVNLKNNNNENLNIIKVSHIANILSIIHSFILIFVNLFNFLTYYSYKDLFNLQYFTSEEICSQESLLKEIITK